jgi:hypothetical protein
MTYNWLWLPSGVPYLAFGFEIKGNDFMKEIFEHSSDYSRISFDPVYSGWYSGFSFFILPPRRDSGNQ